MTIFIDTPFTTRYLVRSQARQDLGVRGDDCDFGTALRVNAKMLDIYDEWIDLLTAQARQLTECLEKASPPKPRYEPS